MITVQGAKTFRQLWPGIPQNADDAYIRHDWSSPRVGLGTDFPAPRWRAIDEQNRPVPLSVDRGGRSASFARPDRPCWIQIEDGQSMINVWFVRASIAVRSAGSVNTHHPFWADIQQRLRQAYGAPQYAFTQLGLISFDSAGQRMHDQTSGRRYGGMVEVVGRVEPVSLRDSQMHFFLARRITGGTVLSHDAQGRALDGEGPRGAQMRVPPAGSNDPSAGQSGALGPGGELYDYDLPGSLMRGGNLVGDRHSVSVFFEQCVVIGTPPPDGVNPWPQITAQGRAVSPLCSWRVNYTATVTRALSSTQGLQLAMTGSVA